MDNLKEFIVDAKENDGIYIYGAGVVAYYLARKLLLENLNINAFIVSSKIGNVDDCFGIPVKEISEINSASCHLIIGVLEDKQDDIVHFLRNRGFVDFYALKNEEYYQIRKENPDIPAEHFHLTRKVINDTNHVVLGNIDTVKACIDAMEYEHQHYRGRKQDDRRYREDFEIYRSDIDRFESDFDLLLNGLEEKSKRNVLQIVSRLHALCDNSPIVYDASEKAQVEYIWNEYRTDGNINGYKISEHRYMKGDICLPVGRFEETVFLYEHGLPLLECPEKLKDKCVIDAGAYVGDSATLIAKKYTKEKVYSFEPMMDNYEKISMTARMNGLEGRIVPVKAALSDKIGKAKLYCSEFMDTCNSLYARGGFVKENDDFEEVECTTIDEFVEKNGLHVGLIKTDVEGAEKNLLRGALNTLCTQRPALSISIYHSVDDFFMIKPWLESLGLGYRFKIFRPIVDFSFVLETVLIAEVE